MSHDMFFEHNGIKADRANTNSGYVFQNDFYRKAYSAKIDSVTMIAVFNESYDCKME
jgi:hypothetical protein